MSDNLFDLGAVAVCAIIGATFALLVVARLSRQGVAVPSTPIQMLYGPVFLFRKDTLIDATEDAISMIAPHLDHMTEIDAVLHVLSPHFPDLEKNLDMCDQQSTAVINSDTDDLHLEVDRSGSRLRIAVKGPNGSASIAPDSVLDRDVRLAELALLRDLTHQSPQLIWQEDLTGRLLWANQAFLAFCDKLRETECQTQSTWPHKSPFTDLHEAMISNGPSTRRIAVPLPAQKAEHWFDITSVKRDDCIFHFAVDANAVVRAEQAQRKLVQTLSQTFAQLSIGLAIFDRRRQLTTFNPALLDMTKLPVDFLSGRPTLDAMLDRLREARLLPEPKDYPSWREKFSALEAAAHEGTYSETWNLPDGQTYRVTGRPHPDGALAFLFEDVSAEVSLTRRFRTDIETGQAVLDSLREAFAVFSGTGTLVMSNKAYAELWGSTADVELTRHELKGEMQIWQSRCAPTHMWSDLHEFVQVLGTRKPWSDDAVLDDGRRLRCHATPIANGMTLVKFSFAPPMKPIIRKLTQPDQALRIGK